MNKFRESNDERAAAAKAQRLFRQKRKESRKKIIHKLNSLRGFNLDHLQIIILIIHPEG